MHVRHRLLLLLLAALLATPARVPAESAGWALLTPEQRESVATQLAQKMAEYIDESAEDAKKEREKNKNLLGMLQEFDRINQQDGTRTSDAARALARQLYGPTEAERILEGIKGGQPRRRHAAETKALRDLLDDLEKPEASWQRRYAQQYGRMLLTASLKDLGKLSQLAGEISAGEYGKLKETVAKAGTALFKQAVSDALDAYNLDRTQAVWDALVGNIDDLAPLARNFLRGEWGQVITGLRDFGTKQGKEISKQAIAGAVGMAFGPLGSVAGEGYVQLLEAEVKLLEWGKETLNRKAARPCLDLYVQQYQSLSPQGESPGARAQAYDAFKQCTERSFGAFAFRETEDFVAGSGLTADDVYGQMAEDYRLGLFQFPSQWLAERIEARKQEAEKKLFGDLSAVQKRMDEVGARFNRASTEVINNLIAAAIGDAKLAELEAKALDALREAAKLADLVKRAHGGVLGNCSAFDGAKAAASKALADSAELDGRAQQVNIALKNFNGCGAEGSALAALQALDDPSLQAQRQLAQVAGEAESEMQNVCRLRESLPVVSNREEARKQIDDISERGARVRGRVSAAQALAQQLRDAAARADAVDPEGDSRAREQLASLLSDAAALPRELEPLQRALDQAKARMARQIASAVKLEYFADDQAKKIRPILDPHRGSALRAQILALIDEVERMLSEMAVCRGQMQDAWNKGGDGGLAWRLQKPIVPELEDLPKQAERAEKLCPVPTQNPRSLRVAIMARGDDVERQLTLIALAQQASDRCVAEAVAAYEGVRTGTGTTDQPDPSKAVYTRTAVTPDAANGNWKTVADGSVSFSAYEGSEHFYAGELSWASPPASIGPEGFSITLNVSCRTEKVNQLATGISISGEGFEFVVSAADRTPVEPSAPVNCDRSDSKSGSITVHVLARGQPSPGSKAKLKIGAFWGAGVTYEYEAR